MAGVLLYNPTPRPITAKYDGGVYLFRPYERKEIFNTVCARTILSRWGKFGLVDVTFDDKIAQKYAVHEIYVHEKAIEGVRLYIINLHSRNQSFQVYVDECGDRKSPERFILEKKHKDVLKELADAEELLKQLEKSDIKQLQIREANLLKKRAEELMAQAEKLESTGEVNGKDVTNAPNTVKKRIA